jgi:hypothetical protein
MSSVGQGLGVHDQSAWNFTNTARFLNRHKVVVSGGILALAIGIILNQSTESFLSRHRVVIGCVSAFTLLAATILNHSQTPTARGCRLVSGTRAETFGRPPCLDALPRRAGN